MPEQKIYVEIMFQQIKKDETDIVIALLSELGFEGFDETGGFLKAYVESDKLNELEVKEIADRFNLAFVKKELVSQNWNTVWENNFKPVIIEGFVAVRAHFHQPVTNVMHEIVVTPKMSFGTGHHATTLMMMQQMRNLDCRNKSILDFGTGTGILSILAEKLGAASVLAIDNDDWSIENSRENIEQNDCKLIRIEKKENAQVYSAFDIILANINRNVIVDNLPFLSEELKAKGYLLLSGLLAEDEEMIRSEVNKFQLYYVNTMKQDQWISMLLSR